MLLHSCDIQVPVVPLLSRRHLAPSRKPASSWNTSAKHNSSCYIHPPAGRAEARLSSHFLTTGTQLGGLVTTYSLVI